jgi:ribosomal protein S18 acetylase RimI-like enzyme
LVDMLIRGSYFTIKDVGKSEINAILQVYKQCEDFLSLGPIPYASERMVLDDLELSKKEGGIFCGIFIDAEMVGIVDFVLDNFDGNLNNAFILLLMISSCHRGKGIGRDVVKAVEEEILKNQSIETILSGVQVNNKSAINFWEKMGYRIVSGPELMPDTTIVFRLKKDIRR